jgi:hypothetical protein
MATWFNKNMEDSFEMQAMTRGYRGSRPRNSNITIINDDDADDDTPYERRHSRRVAPMFVRRNIIQKDGSIALDLLGERRPCRRHL